MQEPNSTDTQKDLLHKIMKNSGRVLTDKQMDTILLAMKLQIMLLQLAAFARKMAFTALVATPAVVLTGIALNSDYTNLSRVVSGVAAMLLLRVAMTHAIGVVSREALTSLAQAAVAIALRESSPDTEADDKLKAAIDKLFDSAARRVAEDPEAPKA